MPGDATVQLTQTAYQCDAGREIEELGGTSRSALEADDGSRIPHSVALAIIRGEAPITAFRAHHTLTLRELARRAGISPSYLSEIERNLKPGSTATLAKIAAALDTTIDTLLVRRRNALKARLTFLPPYLSRRSPSAVPTTPSGYSGPSSGCD